MAFTRVFIRRIPGLACNLHIAGPAAATKKALPSILCRTNELAAISINRSISQETIAEERAKQIGWFQWITEPLVKAMNPPEKEVTAEETKDREELLTRIQALYYKKPPEEPGIEYYMEAFDLLIKYDDWRGVESLWTLAESEGVIFEDDTIDKIEDYLLEVRQRSWYE